MSRSRRNTPIFAVAACRSEREDKKLWHQNWRSRERSRLAAASPEGLCAYLPLLENEVIDVWSMGKDGHRYCSFKEQAAGAKYFADRKGRTRQERASLEKRALRKWMSK